MELPVRVFGAELIKVPGCGGYAWAEVCGVIPHAHPSKTTVFYIGGHPCLYFPFTTCLAWQPPWAFFSFRQGLKNDTPGRNVYFLNIRNIVQRHDRMLKQGNVP
jgi:hypothetical protein